MTCLRSSPAGAGWDAGWGRAGVAGGTSSFVTSTPSMRSTSSATKILSNRFVSYSSEWQLSFWMSSDFCSKSKPCNAVCTCSRNRKLDTAKQYLQISSGKRIQLVCQNSLGRSHTLDVGAAHHGACAKLEDVSDDLLHTRCHHTQVCKGHLMFGILANTIWHRVNLCFVCQNILQPLEPDILKVQIGQQMTSSNPPHNPLA